VVVVGSTVRDPDFETGEPLRNNVTLQLPGIVTAHFRVDVMPGRMVGGDAVNELTVVSLRQLRAFSVTFSGGGIGFLLIVFKNASTNQFFFCISYGSYSASPS
jgi:hypothetical protein